MKHNLSYFLVLFLLASCFSAQAKNYDLRKYGVKPGTEENTSLVLADAIRKINAAHSDESPIVLRFAKGVYHFYPTTELQKEYYISNHDQVNPKNVGIAIENLKNIVLDGQGSQFIFHGRMLPLSIISCENSTFKNFSVDFENPHIIQMKVVANDTEKGKITFEVAPWVKYKVENGVFTAYGDGWSHTPQAAIAFEEKTRHIVYNTSDLGVNLKQMEEIAPHTLVANQWKEAKLIPGTVLAGRIWYRPTPGIFVHKSENTTLRNIKVHYSEGMGLLAQLCNNITLDGFNVCLKGKNDPRYFTAQADATHFSGCKGKIVSINGLYENMMDDAINIHGTYLKLMQRVDNHTVNAAYMHSQCWGFDWGFAGDTVQFIKSNTMELFNGINTIASITPIDAPTVHGAKLFQIKFTYPLPKELNHQEAIGIENLSWTPEVLFSDNIIRNNRARGTLFSTPRKTVVTNNLFDHTSGTAILLCGDCNGWYETGACREVLIKGNTFINSLTNMFQFTNAVISIYPEIPKLADQQKYFHGNTAHGIIIENNRFETFDIPLVYAKSINGLTFRDNKIIHNQSYPAFHWNKHPFFFEKAANITIKNNTFDTGFDPKRDIRLNMTSESEIKVD